jgi:AraC-like DNA-binding protein
MSKTVVTSNWQDDSVLGGWAVAIARAIDSYGIDSDDVFKSCRLDLDKALDTNTRFPVTAISRVLKRGFELTGDENLGLVVAKFIRPTSWHALGISIWASDCMGDSLSRLIRYQRMFNTALRISQQIDEHSCVLDLNFPQAYQPLLTPYDMDAIMATIVLTCRHLADGHFRPLSLKLRRPQPANPSRFERVFRCPIEFEASCDQLEIAMADVTKPLLTRNAELVTLNDRLIQEYLARMDRHNVVNQVHHKLLETLGRELPSQQQMATLLNMSSRNLQRLLQNSGTSYRELLGRTRQELAKNYLQQSHLSVTAISHLLGFSRVGSFTRVFTDWTGLSPSDYRRNHLSS